MARVYSFHRTTKNELGWHPDLKGGGEGGVGGLMGYNEWFWFDGQFENGYECSMGLFGGDRKFIDLYPMSPDGVVHHRSEEFSAEAFKSEPFGASWGGNNYLRGKLAADGSVLGYDVKVAAGDVGLDIATRAVVPFGVKFSPEEPGYSYYNPIKKQALGWWPLAPRAEAEGTITIDGKANPIKGQVYLERQLSSLPLGGTAGAKTGQAVWCWGHFYAGDYTAVWTDSAASQHYGYRHFTPFVLWKGDTVVMSTFQFAGYVEEFGIDPKTGIPYPVVETVKASDGVTELFAVLQPGTIIEHAPGSWYCRQYCDIKVSIRRWGETEEIAGKSVHEWCAGGGWFPFEKK